MDFTKKTIQSWEEEFEKNEWKEIEDIITDLIMEDVEIGDLYYAEKLDEMFGKATNFISQLLKQRDIEQENKWHKSGYDDCKKEILEKIERYSFFNWNEGTQRIMKDEIKELLTH